MRASQLHIVFAGGGTAGHLFPGLAVAEQLAMRANAPRVTFAGSGKEFERRHCLAAGHEYLSLPCQPLPQRVGGAWRFFVDNLRGYRLAKRFLHRSRVSLVVGLGGYASGPMARAAIALKIPLVLLEQNAVAGRATRWLAPSARLVCTSFEFVGQQLPPDVASQTTGNPVRSEVAALHWQERTFAQPKQLLVLGGSGGAHTLNEEVPRALYKLRGELAGWRVVHQSGPRDAEATRELYRKLDIAADVYEFIDDIPKVLSETTLAVCRSGGTTLAELAIAGVPALLAPYPHAIDNHQRVNAEIFAAAGAAVIADERDAAGRVDDLFAERLEPMMTSAGALAAMSAAMRKLARPDAAWVVASAIDEMAKSAPEMLTAMGVSR